MGDSSDALWCGLLRARALNANHRETAFENGTSWGTDTVRAYILGMSMWGALEVFLDRLLHDRSRMSSVFVF